MANVRRAAPSGAVRSLPVLLLLLGALGCQRAPSEQPTAATRANAQAAPLASAERVTSKPSASTPSTAAADVAIRFPAAERVVAIGDLHGDLSAARAALRLACAIDDHDRWIGKQLVVVQTGDQLDRGPQDREILDLIEKLELEAQQAGGRLLVLNGNHEIMNVAADFRYVSPQGFAEFAELAIGAPPTNARVPEAQRGRFVAFTPGIHYAKQLARRPTVAIVGESLFVHGGVLPKHLEYGLARINADVDRWMRGELAELPSVLREDDAPVWTRVFGDPEPDAATCGLLDQVLQTLHLKRMVVGHTVQPQGINAACAERVFRIDVGLSGYYGNNQIQVLELGSSPRILRAARGEASCASAAPGSSSATPSRGRAPANAASP